jgi:hypothetical protein
MPEFRHPGPARAFRRPTLRVRMTLLYGAVICASGVALLGVAQLLAPGLLQHEVRKTGPSQPGAVTAGHSTPTPLPIGSAVFWNDVVALAIMAGFSLAAGWLIAGRFVRPLRSIITNARDIAAVATSSPSSAGRSMTCSGGWRHRSGRSGTSSPTPRTSCGPRCPPGGRCSRSRWPTRNPRWRR